MSASHRASLSASDFPLTEHGAIGIAGDRRDGSSESKTDTRDSLGASVASPSVGEDRVSGRGGRRVARASMKVAWLFPGQGSQEVGMGKALAASSPMARAIFDAVDRCARDAALEALLRRARSRSSPSPRTPSRRWSRDSSAISRRSVKRTRAWPLPAYAAGHSLGEYSALVRRRRLRSRRGGEALSNPRPRDAGKPSAGPKARWRRSWASCPTSSKRSASKPRRARSSRRRTSTPLVRSSSPARAAPSRARASSPPPRKGRRSRSR